MAVKNPVLFQSGMILIAAAAAVIGWVIATSSTASGGILLHTSTNSVRSLRQARVSSSSQFQASSYRQQLGTVAPSISTSVSTAPGLRSLELPAGYSSPVISSLLYSVVFCGSAALAYALRSFTSSSVALRPAYIAMAASSGAKRPIPRKGKYAGYESVIREVDAVTYDQVEETLKNGYVLLDIRPKYERDRIYPEGSIHIEFIRENETSPFDLMSFGRKWASTTYAGFTRDLIRNPDFTSDVSKMFSQDAKFLVVCSDGLRSLVATKTLMDRGGFTNLKWLQDGLLMCEQDNWLRSSGTTVDVGYADAGLDTGLIGARLLRAFSGSGK